MQTNLNPESGSRQQSITPEIADALKTASAVSFNLSAEYFNLDWESREELARELWALGDRLDDDRLADVAFAVARDLEDESEDFSAWETRSDAARRVSQIARSLSPAQEVTANA